MMTMRKEVSASFRKADKQNKHYKTQKNNILKVNYNFSNLPHVGGIGMTVGLWGI